MAIAATFTGRPGWLWQSAGAAHNKGAVSHIAIVADRQPANFLMVLLILVSVNLCPGMYRAVSPIFTADYLPFMR
jgi:hypothetical protein